MTSKANHPAQPLTLTAITWRMLAVFAVTASLGLATRGIRHGLPAPEPLFHLLDNEVFVLIEHLLAGVGVPALVFVLLILPTLTKDGKAPIGPTAQRVDRLFSGRGFATFCAVLGVSGYAYHMLEHELGQMLAATAPGASALQALQNLDFSQLVAGTLGMALFAALAAALIATLTAFQPDQKDYGHA